MAAMAGRPVTVRTLDVGADKELEGATQREDNPALGLRAIRYCLAEPKMYLTQLRALLRASHCHWASAASCGSAAGASCPATSATRRRQTP